MLYKYRYNIDGDGHSYSTTKEKLFPEKKLFFFMKNKIIG
jgi:hypothetical protein